MAELPQDVVFDLDAEQRDPKDVRPVFTTRVGGKVITMIDAEDIDWQDIVDIENPIELIPLVLSHEDREHLMDQEMPGWKLRRLMDAYSNHYGMRERMEKERRQQRRSGLPS